MKVKYTAYTKCSRCSFDVDYYTNLSSPNIGYYECPHCGWKEDTHSSLIAKLGDPPEYARIVSDRLWNLV
jgi:DNA-directed RNA polymerase subunit RPC12/RpoP